LVAENADRISEQ